MRGIGKARRAGYAVAALGCALATTVIAAPAANASAGAYCGTYGNGYTNTTEFIKQPPGCYDFNLTWTKWTGHYRGHLWTSSHGWQACGTTVYHLGGQTYLQVLCSNVITGTPMYVERTDAETVGWNIHVNY
ncbi:MAG TPA: hypothetical protein VJ851_09380 [Jatrophihabitans sp.]|nr:hypothetical protein [Jatrophihabitans sp.]